MEATLRDFMAESSPRITNTEGADKAELDRSSLARLILQRRSISKI